MNPIINLIVLNKRFLEQFSCLQYSTSGSSAIDLRACLIQKNVIIFPNQVILIPTGIGIFIKNPLITAMILPRSGLGHKYGIILGNSIGLIDSDYQGELMVSLWNRSDKKFFIHFGDRIAQLVFVPIIKPVFNIVSNFKYKTDRNVNGFGSSGIK
ncbi:dUTP diphosphatase [Buchnera aphidicola]